MIHQITEDQVGKPIWFMKQTNEQEEGRIKSFNNEERVAWVVYRCAGNWPLYEHFTAQRTQYSDLTF